MSRGKRTCRILKKIRQCIADANDIEYFTSECQYKGDCLGTCPKCEAEVRYLEAELAARRLAGKAVSIAGISIGMIFGGCNGEAVKTPVAVNNDLKMTPLDSIESNHNLDNYSLEDSISECPDEELSGEVVSFDNTEINNKDDINAGKTHFDITDPIEVVRTYGDAEVIEDSKKITDPNHYYQSCEKMPQFPGGDDELIKYINTHIKYPKEAKKNGIQGRVIIQMGINTSGCVTEVKILRSSDSLLDAEAVRVVKSLPQFKPGTMDGKPVNVYYTLPVVFRLDEE